MTLKYDTWLDLIPPFPFLECYMSLPNSDYWNGLWRESHVRRPKAACDPKFWDKRAPEFAKNAKDGGYPDRFMEILKPQPTWRVLDVGCAAGTLAIPLASRVKAVTAMDPSERMRELLKERCDHENIDNVRIVDGRWEDDWQALELGVHDVAIASRSLIVEDLQGAIEKLQAHASRRVILSAMVGDGPRDRRIIEAVGREFVPGADYIVLVNLLRQIGIFANLAFIRSNKQNTYRDVDDAVADMRWMIREMTSVEEEKLRAHLTATLIREGDRWKLPYENVVRWAVVWWDLDE